MTFAGLDSIGILGIVGRAGLKGAATFPLPDAELDDSFLTNVTLKHLGMLSGPRTSVTHRPKSGLFGRDDCSINGSSGSCEAATWLPLLHCPMYPLSIIRLMRSKARWRSLAWIILKTVISPNLD